MIMLKDGEAAERRANAYEGIMGEGPESTAETRHQLPTTPVHPVFPWVRCCGLQYPDPF